MNKRSESFATFYTDVFLPEHQHPLNVALHVFGTLAGLAWLALSLTAPGLWKLAAVLFPAVHAAPGLLGHRFLERNAAVGDARWKRSDHAPWMFILANHRLSLERLTGLDWPGLIGARKKGDDPRR